MVSPDSLIARTDAAIEARVAGVLVLHNLDTGAYARLNDSAAAVWEELREPARLERLTKALAGRYGIGLDRARGDVAAVVDALVERGLIATSPAPRD